MYLSVLSMYFSKWNRTFILFCFLIYDNSQFISSNMLFINRILILIIQPAFLSPYFIAITLLVYHSIFNSKFLISSSTIWIVLSSFRPILLLNSMQVILLFYSLSSPIIFQAMHLHSASYKLLTYKPVLNFQAFFFVIARLEVVCFI